MSAIKKEVIIGDCLEVMPLLGEFDAVVTDPPYEAVFQAAFGKRKLRTDGKKEFEKLNFGGIDDIRDDTARLIIEKSNGWVLCFAIAEGVMAWRDVFQAHGAKWDTTLAWIKPDCAPRFNGQGAARGFECCMTMWAGKGHRFWNSGGKRGVYHHSTNNPDRHGVHKTEKPISLMCELLTDFTSGSQAILDPFMGSGTTGVACVKLGRSFTGIELDSDYFEIACERIRKAYEQPDMFVTPPSKPLEPVQDDLLEQSAKAHCNG